MGAENPMLSTERRVIEKTLRLSSVTHGPSSGPAGQGGCRSGGGGDEQEYIPSLEELWAFADENFPVMHDLYEKLVDNMDPSRRRSLLGEFFDTSFAVVTGRVLKALTRRAKHYTAKISSMFLHKFETSERTTKSQPGSNGPTYMRLATTDIGEDKVQEYNAASHDIKEFFENERALKLALLFNKLLGMPLSYSAFPPQRLAVDRAGEEFILHDLFHGPTQVFRALFDFFRSLETSFEVQAVSRRVGGKGVPDLSVRVSGNNIVNGKSTLVTEYLAMFEYKRPNAGFWIAWKLLNGENLTEAEKSAFFELQTLSSDDFTKQLLRKWQKTNYAQWKAAKEILDQVWSNKVDVKYDAKPKKNTTDQQKDKSVAENESGYYTDKQVDSNRMELELDLPTNEESDPNLMDVEQDENPEAQEADPNAMDIDQNKASSNETLTPSYFVNGTDITELLERAKFKTCCNSFFNGLNQVTVRYAVPNNCSIVVIADGLTIIGGSVHKLEKTQGDSNPLGSYDVLDVHFFKTYMMQTHDQNSSLYWLNLLCNSAMSSSRLRKFGFQFLSKAKKRTPVRRVTKADQERLRKFVRQHNFEFDSQYHCLKSEPLEKSNELLVKRMRASVSQAVAEFDGMFPELDAKAHLATSNAFAIRELFRGSMDEVDDSSESSPHGRSKSVAKVQLIGDPRGKHYVLKEYFGDDESVARMKRELKAYSRVARLPEDEKRKHVAELITFGALDLLSGTPRLFLLLEYVDGPEEVAIDDELANSEIAKVDNLLRSVGVCHNDLEDRNYSWQRSSDGSWSIKVFDFDHATFNDGLAMKPRSAATT